MESERLPRKLAAILYADAAGYAHATGEDEDGSHRLLSDYLDLISSVVAHHRGHVKHFAGDAVLAMFEAAVDALGTALDVQRELAARNAGRPDLPRIEFRIGVHLGDVIEDRGDIYGTGVNVAARLASLAEPGGICISESARIAVGQKLTIGYRDMGERTLKNIAEPVRAYRVLEGAAPQERVQSVPRWNVAYIVAGAAVLGMLLLLARSYWPLDSARGPDNGPAATAAARTPAARTASVAVLPFVSMSDDPAQEYFSDGISEELLNVLANIQGLHVPSRTSSFTFKGTAKDVRTIGTELNVAHVLEGSVRKSGNRLRITAQLVDVATDSHLWSETYDRELTDIFAIQDEIAARVANALQIRLLSVAGPRSASRTDNVEAHDAFLLGRHYVQTSRAEDLVSARAAVERAIALDPSYAAAHALLASALFAAQVYGLMPFEEARTRSESEVAKALALDPNLSEAHFARGQLRFATGDYSAADADLRRAIELNPNYAVAYGMRAFVLGALNRPKEARAAVEKVLELDPLSGFFTWQMANVLLAEGKVDEARIVYRRAVELVPSQPHSYAGLGDVGIMTGHLDEGLLSYLRGLKQDPGQAQMTAIVGHLYRALGDVERAQLWFDRAADLFQASSLPSFFRDYTRLVIRREDPRALLAALGEIPAGQFPSLSARLLRKAALATGDRAGIEPFYRQHWPELFAPEPVVTVNNVGAATDVAWLLSGAGETRRVDALLAAALAIYRDPTQRSMDPPEWAFVMLEVEALALQGRKAEALAAMRRAVDGGWRWDWWQVETDPTLASIKDDPAFVAMIEEVIADLATQLAHVRELERSGAIPMPERAAVPR